MERHGQYQSKSMQEVYRYRFKNISRCPELGSIPVSLISKRLMLDYMHARIEQDNASNATVNREAAMVKGMLFRATEWDIISTNPLRGLKLLPEAEKRQVNLSHDQALHLINELQEPMASIVELAIYTGFRKENLLGMKIESIRFHDTTKTDEVDLIIKGGRKETFPLGCAAVDVIKRNIRNRKEGYVFLNQKTGNRYTSINRTFDRAVRKLGLTVNGTKLRFHDLRHVFGTWLHQAGVSRDIISPLLGHKNTDTTDRYITYDLLSYNNSLNMIPTINRGIKKESPDA